MSVIEPISKMLDTGSFDNEKFSQLLPILEHIPIIPIIIPKENKIIRSSSNTDGVFHENVSRLGYPPPEYAYLSRASMEGQQMFYACVFNTFDEKDSQHAIPPRVVSAFETSYLFRDYETSGKMCTTQSLWKSHRDLHLIMLPNSVNWKTPSKELSFIMDYIHNDERFAQGFTREEIDCSFFLGDLFAHKAYSCLYEITSRVTNQLINFNEYVFPVDGIAYPSVKCDGAGFNICLKPEVADECVTFEGATVTMIIKDGMSTSFQQIADAMLFPEGKLRWRPTRHALNLLLKYYGPSVLSEPGILEFK